LQEEDELEQLDVCILDRLNKKKELRKDRRTLKFKLEALIIGDKDETYNEREYVSISHLKEAISRNKTNNETLSNSDFDILQSCIEGTARLTIKKERILSTKEGHKTKADILTIIQNTEAVFDLEQKRAALHTIDRPQRIRGLAGTGKTIILTMKAALYHLSHPNEEILYTYYTKSLYGLIKTMIEKFYRDFSDNREPNWKKIHILHGWGGHELDGVYSIACRDNGVEPMNYESAYRKSPKSPFDFACQSLLENELSEKYDLTLIDEGQDFPKNFYRLCYVLSKQKRIVWAYDDFQNIFDVTIQDEKETFGRNKAGEYYVDFSKDPYPNQDIVLHVCYRNPKLALIAAFSLGLGIYNTQVLQRLEDNEHWKDLGFIVEKGDSTEGSHMIISRPDKNTPNILNQELGISTVEWKQFPDFSSECSEVAKCINNDIQNEKLKPDDICVICLDQKNAKSYFDQISKILVRDGIRTFNTLEAPTASRHFFFENYVTLSTVNKAKGNEAGMVYIVGADAIFVNRDNISLRNRLFTAITRTKGWVFITGCNDHFKACKEELVKLKDNDFKFVFTQPSRTTTKTIKWGSERQQMILDEVQNKIDDLIRTGLKREDIIEFLKDKK
jgi:superfamily I DNA and RNA helicase